MQAASSYSPGGVCSYCNGTGVKRNLTGTDDTGLPPNSCNVEKAPNKPVFGNSQGGFGSLY